MRKKFNVTKNLRKIIFNLNQYTAGRSIEEISDKYNLDPSRILKLGSNENVLGTSLKAKKAASEALKKVNIYPEVTSDKLASKISKIYKLKNVGVVVGNGMDHIFEMLARIFLHNGDETIISVPTFSCYELCTIWAGAKPRFIPLIKDSYQLNVKKILSLTRVFPPNSIYASSKKTILLIDSSIVFISSAFIRFPVGLFGEQIKIIFVFLL